MKRKNKVNPKTHRFLCHKCGCDISVGKIIKGLVYCLKCGDIIKGIRNEQGKLLQPSPKTPQRKSKGVKVSLGI